MNVQRKKRSYGKARGEKDPRFEAGKSSMVVQTPPTVLIAGEEDEKGRS